MQLLSCLTDLLILAEYMQLSRKPTVQEARVLELLVAKSHRQIPLDWKEDLLVCPMDDGGMGSLRLFPRGEIVEGRVFGEQVSCFQFNDRDGIPVLASLYLDSNGNLFELDVWKVNYGALINFPDDL